MPPRSTPRPARSPRSSGSRSRCRRRARRAAGGGGADARAATRDDRDLAGEIEHVGPCLLLAGQSSRLPRQQRRKPREAPWRSSTRHPDGTSHRSTPDSTTGRSPPPRAGLRGRRPAGGALRRARHPRRRAPGADRCRRRRARRGRARHERAAYVAPAGHRLPPRPRHHRQPRRAGVGAHGRAADPHRRLGPLAKRLGAWLAALGVEHFVARSEVAAEHAFALEQAAIEADFQMDEGEESLAAELAPSGPLAWQRLHGDVSSLLLVDVAGPDGESSRCRWPWRGAWPPIPTRRAGGRPTRESWRPGSGGGAAGGGAERRQGYARGGQSPAGLRGRPRPGAAVQPGRPCARSTP